MSSAEVFSGRVKSPLIRCFGEETAMGTYLSTHAIAVFPQSHRLNGNLTRLDSAACAARGVFKLGYGKPKILQQKSLRSFCEVEKTCKQIVPEPI